MRPKPHLLLVLYCIAATLACFASPQKNAPQDLLRRDVLDPYEWTDGAPSLPLNLSKENLKFDSSLWDAKLVKLMEQPLIYIPDWQKHISLPNPPHNTSPRTYAELDAILKLQSQRTPEHLKSIQRENDYAAVNFMHWFGETEKNRPATYDLTVRAMNDAAVVALNLKKQFGRVRASVLDPRIKPPIAVPGHPAYPSGHSTMAHAFAFIMQEILPERAKFFQQEAFRIAWDREVAGLHYSSDTAAGKLLARQIVDLMLASPKFQADLTKARKEWGVPQ